MQTARKYYAFILFVIACAGLAGILPGVSAAPLHVPVNPGTTNLIAWWSQDEVSGTRNDSHSTNHLTDNNTVSSTTGKKSNAAEFTSANSEYLSIADNASLSMGDIDFTLCSWVRLTGTKAAFPIFAKWNVGANEREYYLIYSLSSDRFLFAISNNGTAQTVLTGSSFSSITTNVWYYVCAWHDATANTISIQVDNGAIDSVSYSSGGRNGTSPLFIGQIVFAGSTYGNGNTDESLIYKKVLSADEREWLYNAGTGRTYCEVADICATATPTVTQTPTRTSTVTQTHTPTITQTPTQTPTETDTPTVTNTVTNTPTITRTPTVTRTNTPEVTDTFTPTITLTPSDTPTVTVTFTPTVTRTPTFTRTPGGPDMPLLNWNGDVTYGDFATTITVSLLCLIVILGLAVFFTLNTLNRKKDR
jgi:hypothetical protein